MDSIDLRILSALQEDGRLSNQDLADRVGLSPSPCLRRVRVLEKDGVIARYTAIVSPEKVGLPLTVFVQIRLARHDGDTVRAFEDRILGMDEVLSCHLMTGDSDYLLNIVTENLQSYERFMRDKLHAIPGIGAIETSFAFGVIKDSRRLPIHPAS